MKIPEGDRATSYYNKATTFTLDTKILFLLFSMFDLLGSGHLLYKSIINLHSVQNQNKRYKRYRIFVSDHVFRTPKAFVCNV